MVNLQRLLGREDDFFALLEGSAQEGVHAVRALKHMVSNPAAATSLADFAEARRKDEQLTTKLEEMLINTFVTPLEREDLEALADVLYKIPKTVEKFAERYAVGQPQVRGADFSRQVALVEQATDLVHQMVQFLHQGELGNIKTLQYKLQAVESEADDLLLELMSQFYEPGFPSLKAVILKELYDLLEKIVDRCRDAGNVMSHVLLKNS